MKKLFYTILGVAMSCSYSWAQEIEYTKLEDLTSKIQNADFKAGTPVNAIIKTYAKDLTDAGLGAGGTELFGMQPVEGWTASAPTDNIMTTEENGLNARACGVMSYIYDGEVAEYGLGGAGNIPYTGEGGATCGLGILGVWGATVQYTQEITLQAGAYLIEIPICNTMGAGGMTNLNGFIAEDGTQYVSKTQSFAADAYNSTIDQIAFILEKETKGVISLGYIAGGHGSADMPHLFYNSVSLYSIDPAPLVAEKIAAAKEKLYALIEAGEQLGADISAAMKVYADDDATLAEIEAAIENQKSINDGSVSDLSEFFINNPHFNQDEALPEGQGITTYDYDRSKNSVNYYGMQPVIGWTASNPAGTIEENPVDKNTGVNNGRACGVVAIGSNVWLGGSQFMVPRSMSDGSASGNVLGFLSCWTATTQYTQNVTIPAGKYTLTISYYNTGGTQNVDKNLMGFIAEDGTEYLSDLTTFKTGSWEKMTVMFELEEATAGKFSVGYTAANTGSGNMPHFFIDGIALNYVGETAIDPSLFALQAAVASGQTLLENSFSSELREKFEAAVRAGQELVSSVSADKEANIAAKDAIISLVTEINDNIKAYETLQTFADDELPTLIESYEKKPLFAELHKELGLIQDDIEQIALLDYSWSTEKINEVLASIPVKVKEATQKAFEVVQSGDYTGEDLDITSLLDGVAYTYSETEYKGSAVPDKEWITEAGEKFKTQYGTAEVWDNSPFKVTRTLNDMPAGTYTITTRAFYRTCANQDNYDKYLAGSNPDAAYVWAGQSKTPLCNVTEIAGADENFGTKLADEITRIPNNKREANYVFTSDEYAEKVTRSVKTTLVDKGDLTFGVCGDKMESDSWVVWYSFEISYNTLDEDIVAKELAVLSDEAQASLGEDVIVSTAAKNALQSAVSAADDAIDSKTGLAEATIGIKRAMAEYQENVEAYTELNNKLVGLEAAIGVYPENQDAVDAAKALQSEISNAIEERSYTTELIKEAMANIRKAIAALRMPDGMDVASDTTPVPCTSMIENASFETGDFTGWAYNTAATGDTKIVGSTDGDYAVENADGSYLFNTWNGSAVDFYVTQTIDVLKAGTYELTALVASDKGNKITVSVNNDAAEVAMENEKGIGTDVSVIFAVKEGESAVIKVSSASWFKADNFRLVYFGANSSKTPTAVEEVAAETDATTIYNISGVRQNSLQKGLNIVKTGNTVKKIFVK